MSQFLRQPHVELPDAPAESWLKVRDFCLGLPGVVEDQKPGQVTYRIGQRPFIVIETFRDTVGTPFNCIAFKASFFDHEQLSSTAGFYPAPYLGGAGWLGCRLQEQPDEVDRLTAVLSRSHRQIAGRPATLRKRPEAVAHITAYE